MSNGWSNVCEALSVVFARAIYEVTLAEERRRQAKLRRGYRQAAEQLGEEGVRIDMEQSPEEVAREMVEARALKYGTGDVPEVWGIEMCGTCEAKGCEVCGGEGYVREADA